MLRPPTTVRGALLAFCVLAAAIPLIVWLAISLSGPIVWIVLALVAITTIAFILRHRLLDAKRERAWVGAFSFGDVNARIRAEQALVDSDRADARALTASRVRTVPISADRA
jgi:hypothetical protein